MKTKMVFYSLSLTLILVLFTACQFWDQVTGQGSGSASPTTSGSPYRGDYAADQTTCFLADFNISDNGQVLTDNFTHLEYAITQTTVEANIVIFVTTAGIFEIEYPEVGQAGNVVYVGQCRAAYNWVIE